MDHLESSWAWLLSIAVLSLECSKGYFFYFYTEISRNPSVSSYNNCNILVLMWKTQPPKIAGKLRGSIFSLSRALNLSSQNLPLRKLLFTRNSRWVTIHDHLSWGWGSHQPSRAARSSIELDRMFTQWTLLGQTWQTSIDDHLTHKWDDNVFWRDFWSHHAPVVCRMLVTSNSPLTCVDEPTFVFRFNVI